MTKFNLEALLFISKFGNKIKASEIKKEFSDYTDLMRIVNTGLVIKSTINKKEWYVLTPKGEKVVETLTEVLKITIL